MARVVFPLRRFLVWPLSLGAIVLAGLHSAWAGDFSWTRDKVSTAINYADSEVVVIYEPPGRSAKRGGGDAAVIPPGMNRAADFGIKRVYASRSYHGDAVVQTSVCWNGTQRCVPLMGGKVTTSAFNGLDPSRPIYLVHKAMGKGPLPTPVYIKGTVIVWFGP